MYETQYSYFINPATKKFLQTNEAHSPITTPPSFYFGDRPKFTLSFPADTISEGDTLVAVLDNENRFLDTKQATGLNPVMAGVLHEVNSDEANAQSLEIQLFDYSKKFADVINGHDNAVTCLFTVYLKSTDGEGNFTFVELGQTIANGEPTVTSPECVWDDLPVTKYYTREELDAVYNQFLAGVSLVVEYSNLAKSYAVGGTGTREGEDTDNAKYYAEMASQAANAVSTMYASIQTLATQIANTKEYIDGLVESIAIDIRDISEIAASVTANAAQVSRDAQSVRQAKSSIDASIQFVSQAKSTVENLATQVSQNAVTVANDKDTVAQLAVQVSNAASQVSRDKADAKGYAESASASLSNVQTIQTDVTQKQTAITTMKNTIQGWYNQISSWYDSIQTFMEQMQGWWTDVDTWQQQVSEDKDAAETARDEAVTAKNNAVTAKTAAETAQTKAETAQTKAETAQTKAEEARDEAISTLANKRDILQTLVTSSSTALVVEAGKSYNWTVSAASTISMKAADKIANKETRIDIYIDLQSGGSVSGDGVTVADAVLQSGWYKLIWDGTNATLYSTKAGGAASVITIPPSTTSYTLQDNKHYQQVPDSAPTYTLPVATMDGLVHEITVLVDFLHVTSCSFVDAGGVPVTLQSAISPQIGEAYVFRCYWYGKWRVVPLKIRNAATASSSNGVVSVSDAVAGDALALKMVAPRSVVMNQQFHEMSITYFSGNNARASFADGVCTFTATSQYGGIVAWSSHPTYLDSTHVYMLRLLFNPTTSNSKVRVNMQMQSAGINPVSNTNTAGVWNPLFFRGSPGGSGTAIFSFQDMRSSNRDEIKIKDLQWVDLTQYFNGDQTLINSIQSWDDLVAYDPRFASYVEYNTGTVEGVQPTVKVTGKNLFDVTPAIDVTCSGKGTNTTIAPGPFALHTRIGQVYTISCKYDASNVVSTEELGNVIFFSIVLSDGTTVYDFGVVGSASGTGVSSKTFSANNPPVKINHISTHMRFASGTVRVYDIQLELGSTATSYEPYHDGGTAQAPELFAVGNAADEYEAVAGVTTRKMASVDLGTLTWGRAETMYSGKYRYIATVSGKEYNGAIICSVYLQITDTYGASTTGIVSSGVQVLIYDSTKDALSVEDFKTAMSGIYLYYELETPTTSASTPAQISLQAGSNTAMQTDGGRTLAELAMTYENLPTD